MKYMLWFKKPKPLLQALSQGAKNQKNHKNQNLFLPIYKPILNQLNQNLSFLINFGCQNRCFFIPQASMYVQYSQNYDVLKLSHFWPKKRTFFLTQMQTLQQWFGLDKPK